MPHGFNSPAMGPLDLGEFIVNGLVGRFETDLRAVQAGVVQAARRVLVDERAVRDQVHPQAELLARASH